jgi:hypothetical protein
MWSLLCESANGFSTGWRENEETNLATVLLARRCPPVVKLNRRVEERTVKKTLIVVVPFIVAGVGVAIYFTSAEYKDAGIGLVIVAYIMYIIPRLMMRKKRTGRPAEETPEDEEDTEPEIDPDSWEALREKAIEALERKLRGQKLAIGSFFPPSHAEYPVLAKIREDISGSAAQLELKVDYEVLKLRREAPQTADLLEKAVNNIRSEDDIVGELAKLKAES